MRAGKTVGGSICLPLTFLRGGEVLGVRHGGLQLAASPWQGRQSREGKGDNSLTKVATEHLGRKGQGWERAWDVIGRAPGR